LAILLPSFGGWRRFFGVTWLAPEKKGCLPKWLNKGTAALETVMVGNEEGGVRAFYFKIPSKTVQLMSADTTTLEDVAGVCIWGARRRKK
jgi:hypothetical protein